MLELTCDADHVVEDERLADLLNIPHAQIRGMYFMQHMAFRDGHLAIRAPLYFDRELTETKGLARFRSA